MLEAMHHTLKLYSRYREAALKFYLFWAGWTKIPVIGLIVKMVGNWWGKKAEAAILLKTDEAEAIVDLASELAVGPCACRQMSHNCDNPVQAEIMLGIEGNIFITERPQDYRRITKEEAKTILRDCHERGLIHSIIKCRDDYYAICNCCTCCCVPLRLSKVYGIKNALVRKPDIIDEFKNLKNKNSKIKATT
jgi:hypothetical protein